LRAEYTTTVSDAATAVIADVSANPVARLSIKRFIIDLISNIVW
jgi:hypothetical protein